MGRARTRIGKAVSTFFLAALGYLMMYPLLWLLSASFKSTNNEIFGSSSLLPRALNWHSYVDGWRATGYVTFSTFYANTFMIVIPTVLFTILSSVFIAYGFSRFTFRFKKVLFSLMLATMMLPDTVTIIPQYILFRTFGWLNTFKPFIIPALFGAPFFIFLMVQFMRGIPKELDEAAFMDGCGTFRILWQILTPLCMPAVFTILVFRFLWTWNDFFGPLIYLNSVRKFTVALGLRMSDDVKGVIEWSNVFAMSFLSIIPCILTFFLAQKYFVEGISTTGIKG